jgi:GNAT superfamily N-acetyltransferase
MGGPTVVSAAVLVRAVRPTETAVCNALGALTVAAYVTLPGHVPEPGYERELADVAARAAMPDTTVLVAVDGERLLGGVTYVSSTRSPMAEHDDAEAGQFRMLAVAPEAQGHGVGEALVRACIERSRADGHRRLRIHSTPWMVAAHRLYERLGFVRDPATDWSPVPGIDLLGFVREVEPLSPPSG